MISAATEQKITLRDRLEEKFYNLRKPEWWIVFLFVTAVTVTIQLLRR
jgi:hypothetical protein